MHTIFETDRLILKVLSPAYAPLVLEFYEQNKEYFEPWEPARVGNFYTENFHRANLGCECNEIMKSAFLRYWIFRKEKPSEIAGTVCFSNMQRGAYQSCALGYKMDHLLWCRGYAEEACRSAISVIYDSYHIHRIEALVHPSNLPSLKLIEKLGFYREGLSQSCIKINGSWEDHYRYSMITPYHGQN